MEEGEAVQEKGPLVNRSGATRARHFTQAVGRRKWLWAGDAGTEAVGMTAKRETAVRELSRRGASEWGQRERNRESRRDTDGD